MWDKIREAFDQALFYIGSIAAGVALWIALVALPDATVKTLGIWLRVSYAVGIALVIAGVGGLIFSPAVGIISRFRRPDLSIRITSLEWTNYHELALIVELSVRVTNNAPRRQQLVGTGFGVTPNVNVLERIDDPDVQQFRDMRRQQRQLLPSHRWLDPGDSVTGWMVEIVGPPAAGAPTLTISVYDEFDEEYKKVVKGRPRHIARA